jgi:hypothetical protein
VVAVRITAKLNAIRDFFIEGLRGDLVMRIFSF